MTLINRHGQSLLAGVLMILVLGLSIPMVVYVNRIMNRHGVTSDKRTKARLIADEGLSFALRQVATGLSVSTWPPLTGSASALDALDGAYKGLQGNRFQIDYRYPHPKLTADQIAIDVRPMSPDGAVISGASLFAAVSRRTLGVLLPNGYSAPAAIVIGNAPVIGASPQTEFRVEWGPIVCRVPSPGDLNLRTGNLASQRPRKFSSGGITGRCDDPDAACSTDQREYWAYASPGFASVVDENAYLTDAQADDCSAITLTCPEAGCSIQRVGTSCYFKVVDGYNVIFPDPFVFNEPDKTIFVDGHVHLKRSTIDVSGSGAFIVRGDLYLESNGYSASETPVTLTRPANWKLDDPYGTCTSGPCLTGVVPRHIDIHGFLNVYGTLYVEKSPGAASNWTLQGVARIANTLTMPRTASPDVSFYVYFDEAVSRRIKTTNFDVQVDSITFNSGG